MAVSDSRFKFGPLRNDVGRCPCMKSAYGDDRIVIDIDPPCHHDLKGRYRLRADDDGFDARPERGAMAARAFDGQIEPIHVA